MTISISGAILKSSKGKENKEMLEYMNSLAGVYKDYDNYVKMVEAEGKKPVSLIRYAFGDF